MKTRLIATLAGMALAATALPAMAAGDVENGKKEFNKCKACHTVESPAGDVVVKGGKTGPNLFGILGQPAASRDGYKYSNALAELGEAGEIWTEDDLIAYVTDPNKFIAEKTGDTKSKSKMTFKLNRNQQDVVAFLASTSETAPAEPAAD